MMASHVSLARVAGRVAPRNGVARQPAWSIAAHASHSSRVRSEPNESSGTAPAPIPETSAVDVRSDAPNYGPPSTATATRRGALTAALAACVSTPSFNATASESVSSVDPRSYRQTVPTLFAPLYGNDSRETRLTTVVPDTLWTLEQNLALGPLETPLRCVVIKLEDGSLWVHAPLAPTEEFFSMIESLGEVKHLIVPTYALEHKIFAKDALARWPESKLWVAPGQFSFPFEVSNTKVFGREPDGVLGVNGGDGRMEIENENSPSWVNEIGCDVLRAGKFDVLNKKITLYEATFLHKQSKTLIVTDAVAYIPSEIPALQTPEKLLLVGKFSTDDPQPPDVFENRLRGWKKMALLVTYFFPEHEELVNPGLVEWSEGWEDNFEALADRLLVPPVVRATLYNQDPARVQTWVDRVYESWDFDKVIPAHWAGPVDTTPEMFRNAFRFLEDNNLDPFPQGDMARGLKPIADGVVKGRSL